MDNRFRFFLEESDHPQGINVFADIHDGFGGLSSEIVESLREEVGKLPIVVYGFAEEQTALHNKVYIFCVMSA